MGLTDAEILKGKVMNIIIEKYKVSGGHNGCYPSRMKNELKVEYPELREVLNQLFKEKKIILKDGSQGKLVFPNVKKNKK